MQFLPCLLCGKKLQKRTDKHQKPYFVCDPCGIQLFVRRPDGIKRLDELLRSAERHALSFQYAAKHIFEVQALISEIDGTKKQIAKVSDEIGFFFQNEEKIRIRNALKIRLENLLHQFDEMCAKSA